MCVGIGLEYFKGYREWRRSISNRRANELAEINTATVALRYNAELFTHFALQNVLPHYDDSHAALKASESIEPLEADWKFLQRCWPTEEARSSSGNA